MIFLMLQRTDLKQHFRSTTESFATALIAMRSAEFGEVIPSAFRSAETSFARQETQESAAKTERSTLNMVVMLSSLITFSPTTRLVSDYGGTKMHNLRSSLGQRRMESIPPEVSSHAIHSKVKRSESFFELHLERSSNQTR